MLAVCTCYRAGFTLVMNGRVLAAFFGKAMLLAAKEGHANIVRILLGHDAHPLVRCRRTGACPRLVALASPLTASHMHARLFMCDKMSMA